MVSLKQILSVNVNNPTCKSSRYARVLGVGYLVVMFLGSVCSIIRAGFGGYFAKLMCKPINYVCLHFGGCPIMMYHGSSCSVIGSNL